MDALAAMDLKLSIWWQALPYFVLTAGEVLVSATGSEFAYTHAPKSLKSTMSGIWLLTISAGNLLVAGITWATRQSGGIAAPSGHAASASQFFRYAALTFVVSAVFLGVIRRFENVDGTGEAAKA